MFYKHIQERVEQSDQDSHCLSLYLTYLNKVGKHLQQTTKVDGIFRRIFDGVLRAKTHTATLHCIALFSKGIVENPSKGYKN